MENTEKINKENIVNEDEIIIDYDLLEELVRSNIKNCVFKLKYIVEIDGKSASKLGTGFTCNISNIKVLITNNHVINQKFLDKEKLLTIYNDKDEKIEINLELKRYKYTEEELDFTIIEILEEDNIIDYLEIDEFIDSTDYINENICSLQYPCGQKLQYSQGRINKKKIFIFCIQ